MSESKQGELASILIRNHQPPMDWKQAESVRPRYRPRLRDYVTRAGRYRIRLSRAATEVIAAYFQWRSLWLRSRGRWDDGLCRHAFALAVVEYEDAVLAGDPGWPHTTVLPALESATAPHYCRKALALLANWLEEQQ